MRNPLQSFMFCLFLALPLAAQQSFKDIQAELEGQYKGHAAPMRLSFSNSSMQFDSDGNPKRKPNECESWTLCKLLQVEKISVTDHAINVEGQRIGVAFENGKQSLYRLTDQFVSVEIGVVGTTDLQNAKTALCKIFICGNEKFADYLPYAWARYFEAKTAVPSPAPPPNGNPSNSVAAEIKTIRVEEGVMAAKLISYPHPQYPATAKAYRQEGIVVMAATIGKDGKIHDLFLTSPVGFGLDEAALDAVRKWVYRPTTLKGEPVEVQTTINVNFTLRK